MEGVIGFTTLFAGNFAPKSWAFCQGQLISIPSNTALFSILGTTYGGNGTTNFGLPDLRGRAVVGAGQGPGLQEYSLGEAGGSETQIMAGGQLPLHAHPLQGTITPKAGATPTTASPANAVYGTGSNSLYNFDTGAVLKPFTAVISTGSTGQGTPFSILQPVLGLNYVICTQGVFPSRN